MVYLPMETAYELQDAAQEDLCRLGRYFGPGRVVHGAFSRRSSLSLLAYELALSMGPLGTHRGDWTRSRGWLGELSSV